MTLNIGSGIIVGQGIGLSPFAPVTIAAGNTTPVQAITNSAINGFYPISGVSGGFAPYTYILASGSTLPTGLSLNATTGQVTGTPTATFATHNVSFAVQDSQRNSSTTTVAVSFTVNNPISALANTTVTSISVGQNLPMANFVPLIVTGGYTPYTYSISSGTLPTGITLNSSTGIVSGTPTTVQAAANVTFSVQDSQGSVAANTDTTPFTVLGTYSAQVVVIAGSGFPGLGSGGGGGAGGYRVSCVNLVKCTSYTFTVGGGGGARSSGTHSSFTGCGVSLSVSGGGRGGNGPGTAYLGCCSAQAIPGGSGGGGGFSHATPTYIAYSGGSALGCCAGVGQPGGPGYAYNLCSPAPLARHGAAGGGGGGAGGAGSTGTATFCGTTGGPGGRGILWPYNNTYYSGGGGGKSIFSTGSNYYGANGLGSCNFGGATTCASHGGGVLLLIPTPNYPGNYPAQATTPPAAPGYTVLTFASSNTYIA